MNKHKTPGVALFLSLSVATVTLADWPQWRGPARLGFASSGPLIDKLPPDGIQAKWKFDSLPGGNSGGWGSPAIEGDKVYIFAHTKERTAELGEKQYPWLAPEDRVGMSDEEYEEYERKRRAEDAQRAQAFRFEQRLVCLDLHTGELIWERTTPGQYTRFTQSGTPCVQDGKVFILGSGRIAYCHDAATGEILWQTRLPGEFRDEYFASSFAVHDGVALVACGPLFAIETDGGRVLWNGDARSDYGSHSSPVVWTSQQTAVAICNTSGNRTVAYQISDGQKLWELETGAERSSPVVVDDTLLTYGGSRKNGLKAFRISAEDPTATPDLLWQFRGAADSGSTPVVAKTHVFVQGEKRLAKVDLEKGDRVWQTTMSIATPRYTSPIVVGDQLLFAWEGLLAYAAETDNDRLLYDAKIDSGGRLISEDDLRRDLGIDELERSEEGRKEAEKLWQKRAISSGPLRCSTPAFSDGHLVVRLGNAIACFDLRAR
jgi:outer membrane protein assembly factor BamB